MKKRGFTLIELLVIIVILGTLAAIAIPSVSGVIDSSKKKTLRSSISNIERIISQRCNEQVMDGEDITYKYIIYNGEISGDVEIKYLPNSGEIQVSDECHVNVGIVEGKYCAIKKDNDVTINTNIYHCNISEEEIPETERACFIFNKDTHTIEGYNYANKSCPKSVSIPAKINGVPVEHIAGAAFMDGKDLKVYAVFSNDHNNNYYYYDLYENALRKNAKIYSVFVIKFLKSNMTKKCYYNNGNSFKNEATDYVIKDTDNYDYCSIDLNNLEYEKDYNQDYTTKIENVDFSKAYNLQTIGNLAFAYGNIKKVNFGSLPRMESIGISVFENNIIFGKVDLSGLRNVKEIPNYAFYGNSIAELYLPSKLEKVGEAAFYGNDIDFITLPTGIKVIADSAFSNNMLSSLKIPETVEYLSGFNSNNIIEVKIPISVKKIGDHAFYSNRLKKITIPSSVEDIGNNAFYSNYISKLVLNEGLKTIGVSAFARNSIESIKLPSSLINLSPGAFTINNVPESQVFVYGVKNGITDKTVLNSYAGKVNPSVINVPNGVRVIESYALYNTLASTINIPNSVTTLKSYAVTQHLSRSSTINIGSGIEVIEPNAFYCDFYDPRYADGYFCVYNIKIKKKVNEISGSPWGDKYAKITWLVK